MKTLWFIFNKKDILLHKKSDGSFEIPAGDNPYEACNNTDIITQEYSEIRAKAFSVEDMEHCIPNFEFVPLRKTFFFLPEDIYDLACKMEELVYWSNETKFCGRCGGKMKFSSSISKTCTKCGHEIWPSLQIAIIVLVKHGNKVLLVQSKNFKADYMGLVAGFVETGETLEQAVHREVLEETGITIKNLSYVKSQAWPFPCNLMAGFVADYKSGEIRIQESELNKGGWFSRENMPALPDEASIARQLINAWVEDKI